MSKRKALESPQESSEEDPDEFIVSSPSNFGSMMSSLGPWEREDYERFLREAPEDFGLTREEVDALTKEDIDEMYKKFFFEYEEDDGSGYDSLKADETLDDIEEAWGEDDKKVSSSPTPSAVGPPARITKEQIEENIKKAEIFKEQLIKYIESKKETATKEELAELHESLANNDTRIENFIQDMAEIDFYETQAAEKRQEILDNKTIEQDAGREIINYFDSWIIDHPYIVLDERQKYAILFDISTSINSGQKKPSHFRANISSMVGKVLSGEQKALVNQREGYSSSSSSSSGGGWFLKRNEKKLGKNEKRRRKEKKRKL